MWKRLPLALTVRWTHGPPICTAESVATVMIPRSPLRTTGDLRPPGAVPQRRDALLDRGARPAQPGDAAHPDDGDQRGDPDQQEAGPGHDEERGPVPDAQRLEAIGEGEAEQDQHEAAHERRHAEQGRGHADPADVTAQFDL